MEHFRYMWDRPASEGEAVWRRLHKSVQSLLRGDLNRAADILRVRVIGDSDRPSSFEQVGPPIP